MLQKINTSQKWELPGEVLGCAQRAREFVADDRWRFTGMPPGKPFGPKPPVMDRFPVTRGEGMPNSELTTPDDQKEIPYNYQQSTNKKLKLKTTNNFAQRGLVIPNFYS